MRRLASAFATDFRKAVPVSFGALRPWLHSADAARPDAVNAKAGQDALLPNPRRVSRASYARRLLPKSRPDVDVRRVDELRQSRGIHFAARVEPHVAPALARALEQTSRVLQQRTKEEADVVLQQGELRPRRERQLRRLRRPQSRRLPMGNRQAEAVHCGYARDADRATTVEGLYTRPMTMPATIHSPSAASAISTVCRRPRVIVA